MKLRTKLLALFGPLLLFSVGVVPWLAQIAVQDIVEQEVIKRGLAATNGIAADPVAISAFASRSEAAFIPLLQSLQQRTGALYALVLDPDGRVLAHTNVGEQSRVYTDPFTRSALAADAALHRIAPEPEGGQPTVDIACPIWTDGSAESGESFLLLGEESAANRSRLGTFRIALPLRDAFETGERISGQVFWILTLGSGLALVLALVLTRGFLRPVQQLAAATERLARGSLGATVPISSQDEIGDLGRRFNQMSRDLAETTVSKDLLDRTLGNMLDAVIVTDDKGRVSTVNKSALDLLACSAEEIKGRLVFDFFSIAGAGAKPRFDASLVENPISNREGVIETQTGAEIAVLVNISAFVYDDESTSFIVSVRNIDAWKRAERELEKQKALSMHSDRLRSLGEMAAGISHELNQPLMGVRGLAEHILVAMDRGWDLPEDTLRQRVGGIVEQADRMVHIIQHVLMFARDAGKEELSLEGVNEIVRSALDLLGAQLRSHDVQLDCDLAEALPAVSVNRFSLEEVILNLVNNARDAVEERFPRNEDRIGQTLVAVKTALVPGQQNRVRIEVKDSGPGIAPDIADKIFDPFFTTKEPGKGTGLGLAISRSIIEGFGGDLQVHSVPDQGTTFSILLPAAPARGG